MTHIEWTDETWNPTSGCTRVSAGCDHCYAVAMTHRLEGMGQQKYAGLTVLNPKGERHFNGTVRTHESELDKPFRWRKPRRVFVNSMSDLFHKDVSFHFVDKVMAVIALTPQHTYQVLTKRPERMAEYFASLKDRGDWIYAQVSDWLDDGVEGILGKHWDEAHRLASWRTSDYSEANDARVWNLPLPNLWLGTSIESREVFRDRYHAFWRVPAAVKFLSLEPLLSDIDLAEALWAGLMKCHTCGVMQYPVKDSPCCECEDDPDEPGPHADWRDQPEIDWVIVGGESGPGARPCNVDWIRNIIAQCEAAGVPCFVKQLGACPYDPSWHGDGTPCGSRMMLNNRKGGAPSEWPEDLRVREWPGVR